jgi:hypothetical protein
VRAVGLVPAASALIVGRAAGADISHPADSRPPCRDEGGLAHQEIRHSADVSPASDS